MRKIIYTRPDGGLSVVHPVRNTHPRTEDLTDAEVEQRAWDGLPEDAINPQFVEESVIPSDRTFRNAWASGAGVVEVNMEKAREIKRDAVRAEREPLLEALDVEFMRAVEQNDANAQAAIIAQKNALRDATIDLAIEAAQTPSELKAVKPAAIDAAELFISEQQLSKKEA